MNYNELTRHHFESAQHAGVLEGPCVRRGSAGDRAQGIWVQFDLLVDAGAPLATLRDVKYLVYGCPHVIAVVDWLAGRSLGRDARAGLAENIAALQQRFDVPTEKLGRLLIVEDAWLAAVSAADALRAGGAP